MQKPGFLSTRRHLPHRTLPGSTYYVTFHLEIGELTPDECRIVLDHVKAGHGRFYDLAAVSVMPDHVHVIFRPQDDFTPSRIMKGIKRASARLLNLQRNTKGRVWQKNPGIRFCVMPLSLTRSCSTCTITRSRRDWLQTETAYDGWYFNPDFL